MVRVIADMVLFSIRARLAIFHVWCSEEILFFLVDAVLLCLHAELLWEDHLGSYECQAHHSWPRDDYSILLRCSPWDEKGCCFPHMMMELGFSCEYNHYFLDVFQFHGCFFAVAEGQFVQCSHMFFIAHIFCLYFRNEVTNYSFAFYILVGPEDWPANCMEILNFKLEN